MQRWSISWTNADGYQHGYVMSVDLTVRGLSVRPGLGYGMVNDREPTSGIAGRTGAVAGINGDLFNWTTELPWGGVGVAGQVAKTPKPGRPSQFYITAKGKVGIGALDWTGSITQLSSTGKVGLSHGVYGINTLQPANTGHLTLFTPAITSQRLCGCPAVTGTVSAGTLTVHHVYSRLGSFSQLASGHKMLAACGTPGRWLLRHAPLGQRLRLAQKLTTPAGAKVVSFISGERVLRRGGKAYYDKGGLHTNGINPETAACVSRDQQHLLFVAVDGWIGYAPGGGNGFTLPELGSLVAALHCYSTVVFDGGGSTTMVVRSSGTMHVINQMPKHYGERPIPNALLIYKA